jgi:2-dehydropantoate 2-reductase
MRIAILGAGAVGGVVAWHLARAGADPVIVARPQSARRLSDEGLTLADASASQTVAVRASADPEGLGRQDLVLVGLKAQDWQPALPLLRPLIGNETILVPMLNGVPFWFFQGVSGPLAGYRIAAVDPDGALGDAIGPTSILGCVVYMGAARQTPSRVRWNGRKRLVLGEPAGGESERLRRVASLLAEAGLNAEVTADIRMAVWQKILGNVAHNPLSVVTGATIGRLAAEPHLRSVMGELMQEAAAIGEALGLCGFDIEERLKVAPEMADFRTSMLQDLEAGRPLELAAIVDAVIEIGQVVGVPTPALSTVGALALDRWLTRNGSS